MSKENKESIAIFTAYDDDQPFDPVRPERDLLRAILNNALNDASKGGNLRQEATEFFLSKEEDYIFSFRSICNHLDIDHKSVLKVVGLKDCEKS